MVTVRHFAAAAEAAACAQEPVEASTLGELTGALVAAHGDGYGRVLARCSMLVDGRRTADPDAPLTPDSQVDVLPPFAGG